MTWEIAALALGLLLVGLALDLLRFFWPSALGLSVGETTVLSAYHEALLSEVPWGAQVAEERALERTALALVHVPPLPRAGVRLALWAIDNAPWITLRAAGRFSRLHVATRLRVLRSLAQGAVGASLIEILNVAGLMGLAAVSEVQVACGIERSKHVAACRKARHNAELRGC